MKTQCLNILIMSCLFLFGCNTDSKESLENKSVSIMKEMAKTINSINDETSASKAVLELEKLQKELDETKIKLAEYGNQDIASKYGMRMYNCYMSELVPALEKVQRKAPGMYDKIADIITSGEHTKLKQAHEEAFGLNLMTGQEYIDAHPEIDKTILECIKNKQVIEGMNKEQIIASLGTPESVGRDNKGGEELIYYLNGKMKRYYLKDGIYSGTKEIE